MQSVGHALHVNGRHALCPQQIRASPAAAEPRSAATRHICMCTCKQDTQASELELQESLVQAEFVQQRNGATARYNYKPVLTSHLHAPGSHQQI